MVKMFNINLIYFYNLFCLFKNYEVQMKLLKYNFSRKTTNISELVLKEINKLLKEKMSPI
jgi:hypothetical protein